MPMISKPELELNMSNSNRDKSHSEGLKQGKGLGNFATNPPSSDELLANPQKVPQRGGNSEILQWMGSTIIQASSQKDQEIPCRKERSKQGRSPSGFYQKVSSQLTFPRREEEKQKELEEAIFPELHDPKNLKK
ncbi:hypothetical protein O181_121558 [Austropuccinia psidii MF-1]|uniref:Uncharacterized protein n=1 Tax=Austropuccinia psidii MF-1 TaxID=1389203 RepID=A0A9Q3KI61_9BASI|nr:hypothetical protein [Austropuccinia psidii MF-1]